MTYPDSLGGDLKALDDLVRGPLDGLFAGIHILPPFPSSGDRGFAPITYEKIDPRFGSWDEIADLAQRHDVLLDLMINHLSRRSVEFRDFMVHGRRSRYADLFITVDKVWPDGAPPGPDLARIFLRKPDAPFSVVTIEDTGTPERVWTSFGSRDWSEQIDLDVTSPDTRRMMTNWLRSFARHGVKIVRLDAVGYVIKRAGTSCFMVEPEIYDFLDWIIGVGDSLDLVLLPEVHDRYATHEALAAHGYWTYDFVLPYAILEALIIRSPIRLRPYLLSRSAKQFTMLDCHDGVPVKPDMDGLYAPEDVRRLVRACLDRGANLSLVVSAEHQDPDGFDVHQIRGTYYSLLGCDDDAYIAARAIQFFVPGVPQVYYVGLLAGQNDVEAVARTGEGREINRHNFTVEEIGAAADKGVVRRLERLIRLRNTHPAFDGEFRILDSADTRLRLAWSKEGEGCVLDVDFVSLNSTIECVDAAGQVEQLRL